MANARQTTFWEEPSADATDALALLADGLPAKATVTVPEARRYLYGVSRRTIENWIDDGTLLVGYADRHHEQERSHPRIIVRAERPYDPTREKFLTLAELRIKRSNVGG